MKSVIIGIVVMIAVLIVVDCVMDDQPKTNVPSIVQPADPSFSNFKIN